MLYLTSYIVAFKTWNFLLDSAWPFIMANVFWTLCSLTIRRFLSSLLACLLIRTLFSGSTLIGFDLETYPLLSLMENQETKDTETVWTASTCPPKNLIYLLNWHEITFKRWWRRQTLNKSSRTARSRNKNTMWLSRDSIPAPSRAQRACAFCRRAAHQNIDVIKNDT